MFVASRRLGSLGCIAASVHLHSLDNLSECTANEPERGPAFANQLPPLAPNCRRIYLLRHGETDWNKRGLLQGGGFDIELNGKGRMQAALVGAELSTLPIGIVASSHLSRANETADNVKMFHPKAKRTVVPALGEMRFGSFEGVAIHGPEASPETLRRYERTAVQMRLNTGEKWPGQDGESVKEVADRACQAIVDLMSSNPKERHICCVAHGRTNKIILASLLWGDISRHEDMKQDNTCINIIDFNELNGTWEPILLSYVGHTTTTGRSV
mmetsp:Transcript_58243/g.117046  ORF Transcript_58243/g.117046 Transcript_58243/m.117046 type:complete len:270 (-) Transcript_58243:96-905(-)